MLFRSFLRDPGYKLGLGFAVLTDPERSGRIESKGESNWSGYFYTERKWGQVFTFNIVVNPRLSSMRGRCLC